MLLLFIEGTNNFDYKLKAIFYLKQQNFRGEAITSHRSTPEFADQKTKPIGIKISRRGLVGSVLGY